MESSLEPALFQSLLTHITFHIHLLLGIMLKPPSKLQMSQITLQEACALVASLFHHPGLPSKWEVCLTRAAANLPDDGMFTSPAPSTQVFP